MSGTVTGPVPVEDAGGPPPPAAAPRPGAGGGTWSLSWQGVRTVAGLELRQRVRSTRWVVVLALWFVLLLGLTLLIRYAVQQTIVPVGGDIAPDPLQVAQARERAGATLFGLVVFLVLSLGALVAPALSATSVNGDRAAGVLATLQTTLLSPAEIAVGKLLASWTTALALLATAAPFLLWSYLDGGTPAGRLLTTVVVLALTLLVVCAIGLGWSSVAARTASSTVLTYLTVVFLGLGLPLLFLLALPVARQADQVTVRTTVSEAAEPGTEAESEEQLTRCVTEVQELERFHTERVWWLLAPSPYVVVSDAAPRPAIGGFGIDDPLSVIRDGVREARLGPAASEDYCGSEAELITRERARQAERNALPATWPYGLAADLVIGGLFTVVAVRRLRTPTRSLPRGTRVA